MNIHVWTRIDFDESLKDLLEESDMAGCEFARMHDIIRMSGDDGMEFKDIVGWLHKSGIFDEIRESMYYGIARRMEGFSNMTDREIETHPIWWAIALSDITQHITSTTKVIEDA